MILVTYDGSADARAAIDRVAQLMPGAETTVLTVWESYSHMLARSGSVGMGLGGVGSQADAERVDAASRAASLVIATEGAQRATAAGLVAQPRAESRDGSIASTILSVAAEVDAGVVALGTRGRGGVTSFLLGSVSHAVVQHADRAVLVVPSPAVAEERRVRAHRETVPASSRTAAT